MNDFEKVEKLVQKTNVTYEEAKDALEAANGDLLEALVLLERQGKTKGPQQSSYTTSYDDQAGYEDVQGNAKEYERERQRYSRSFGHFLRSALHKIVSTSVLVTRREKEVLRVPLWLALIIAFCSRLHIFLIAVVVSLFFDCRYHFLGDDDLEKFNSFMDKAGKAAEHVREDFS